MIHHLSMVELVVDQSSTSVQVVQAPNQLLVIANSAETQNIHAVIIFMTYL